MAGVPSAPLAPSGFTPRQGMVDPGVYNRALLLTCIGVQISMSPNGVGGGDLGLAGVPYWDPAGVSASIPALRADAGCETHSSTHPQTDSSCSWSDSSSTGVGGGGGAMEMSPKSRGERRLPMSARWSARLLPLMPMWAGRVQYQSPICLDSLLVVNGVLGCAQRWRKHGWLN